ncbi:MAG: hypothetical protein ACRC3B_00460 [Bacteroidia bacterium]
MKKHLLYFICVLISETAFAQFPYAGPDDESALVRNLTTSDDSSYAAVNYAGSDLRLGLNLTYSHDNLTTDKNRNEIYTRRITSIDFALRSDENVLDIGKNYRPGADAQITFAWLNWKSNDARERLTINGSYLRGGIVTQQYLFLIPESIGGYGIQRMRYSTLLAATAGKYIALNSYDYGQWFSAGFSVQGGWLSNSFDGLEQLTLADSFALRSGGRYAELFSQNPVWLGAPESSRGFVKFRLDASLRLFAIGKSSVQSRRSNYDRYSLHLIMSGEERYVSGLPWLFSGVAGISRIRYNRPVLAVYYRYSGKNYGFRLPVDGIHFGTAFTLGM